MAGFKTGEFAGVIFNDTPSPVNLPFTLSELLFAIRSIEHVDVQFVVVRPQTIWASLSFQFGTALVD